MTARPAFGDSSSPLDTPPLADYKLTDNLTATRGRIFLTGTQALIRLALMQRSMLNYFPAYLLVVFASCVLLPLWLGPSGAPLRGVLLPHLLYVQNLYAAWNGPMPPAKNQRNTNASPAAL